MKFFYVILALTAMLVTIKVNAQSFPWNSYTSGCLSSTLSIGNLTRNFTMSGTGISTGFPQYNAGGGGNLATTVDWSNKTSSVTMTISFSKPLVGVTFLLFDVDQTSTWDDKLTITAINETNNTVYPVLTGTSYTTISGANNNIIEGSANNATFSNAPATASFGSRYIKSITIVYSAGSSSPNNPASQVMGIGGIVYENVLPVKLIWFKADKRNNTTDLTWQTENQEGFSHFEIERSATGTEGFETIATLPATSATTGSYSYTDANGARLSQKAFYRLKMADQDGQYKYSAVVMVVFENAPAVMVTPTLLTAGEIINVNIAGINQSTYEVKLFDMSGKLYSQQSGNSRIQVTTTGLRKGMYVVSVNNQAGAKTFRVMVQ